MLPQVQLSGVQYSTTTIQYTMVMVPIYLVVPVGPLLLDQRLIDSPQMRLISLLKEYYATGIACLRLLKLVNQSQALKVDWMPFGLLDIELISLAITGNFHMIYLIELMLL